MYFIKPDEAIQYLYDSGYAFDQSILELLAQCIANGVFTDEDIEAIYSEDVQKQIIESQDDVPTLEDEIVFKVSYQAEEYLFDVELQTAVDMRKEDGRIPMAKLIGNAIIQKINNSGEIVAIERV